MSKSLDLDQIDSFVPMIPHYRVCHNRSPPGHGERVSSVLETQVTRVEGLAYLSRLSVDDLHCLQIAVDIILIVASHDHDLGRVDSGNGYLSPGDATFDSVKLP